MMTNTKSASQNKKRDMKTRFYIFILLIGVALIGWSVFYKDKNNQDNNLADDSVKEESSEDQKNDSGQIVADYFEGILYNSEDPNKGNLKLISKIGDIYIRTSRDFSKFIGLQVLVLVNGTLDKFELIDIQSKLENDGFLNSQ